MKLIGIWEDLSVVLHKYFISMIGNCLRSALVYRGFGVFIPNLQTTTTSYCCFLQKFENFQVVESSFQNIRSNLQRFLIPNGFQSEGKV